MDIAGLQKLTLLDYPGKLACTVFLPGCNLRCPFCHNASLVLPGRHTPLMTQEELMEFLQSRKGKLDGVCVTGGEPTLHHDLPQLVQQIKELGFACKLDTNGTRPEVLRQLLDANLLDYVAMDIKNSPRKYTATCGNVDVLEQAQQSVKLLEESGIDHEFRTTVLFPYHTPEDMTEIGGWLAGTKKYFIQQFVNSGDLIGDGQALSGKEMQILLQAVKPYIPSAELRGI